LRTAHALRLNRRLRRWKNDSIEASTSWYFPYNRAAPGRRACEPGNRIGDSPGGKVKPGTGKQRGHDPLDETPTIMKNPDHCIDICNKLLRGERSAVETYDQAIKKFSNEPVITDLHRLRDEHVNAVNTLAENVRAMGGHPDESAGAWGAFANTVQGAANLLGTGSALEALQKGEQSGQGEYQNALDDAEVMPECKNLIQAQLLPKTAEHIAMLERLQQAA
jgi:uncharacterized protein (TIGR02284 family)